jgi:DNA repair exonuclease SbcCD ATPase subunit
MLERAIPALETFTNEFLGDEDLRVEIEPVRDLRSGEQKSEVHVRYRDGLGLQDLASASGEQQVKLGLALRFALARVQAEAHGITPSLVLCDEGLAALDSDQKVSGQRILARVADWAGRVLFVSHDEEVRAAADSRIAVAIRDGASIVESVE